MQIIRDLPSLRSSVAALREGGRRVAFVPTMGALHDGHLSLVRAGFGVADAVVVSIFVNPTQFGPNEDFDAYPRTEDADAALLRGAGVALLWAPPVAVMYPDGHATRVHVDRLGDFHDGLARPGHFDGVATVVAKLLCQVGPDVALFGEKDWQQLAIIRRMARDLDLPVRIDGVPTARAPDGLALSSRNAYLSAAERRIAAAFPAALRVAADAMAHGAPVATTLDTARAAILDAGFDSIDYVTLADADTLVPLDTLTAPGRLLAAARVGKTRLIDNVPVISTPK